MYRVTKEVIARMLAAQDRAAEGYWSYPPACWQRSFQAQWLLRYELPETVTVDGVTYGE